MENVVLCRAGRDFVEITQKECGIIAAALAPLLKAAADAENHELASDVNTLITYFLNTARNEQVEGLLLFAVSSASLDRRLYKQVSE